MDLSAQARSLLDEYLINVIGIPVAYAPSLTWEQRDRRRRELHDLLVKEFGLDDRGIVSRCAEAAYSRYKDRQTLASARNGFMHELDVALGRNPLTDEEEQEMDSLSGRVSGREEYDRIEKAFFRRCDSDRKEHWKAVAEGWRDRLSKETTEELLERLRKIPEEYRELCVRMGEQCSRWFHWEDVADLRGTWMGCVYYRMEAWFGVTWFYHDWSSNVRKIEDGLGRFNGSEEHRKWALDSLACLYAKFDGAREYLSTPWTRLVEIFLSCGDSDGTPK